MDIEEARDGELVAKLRRLDTSAAGSAPGFDYDTMLERRAAAILRARRRLALARGTAALLAIAVIAASVWRFDQRVVPAAVEITASATPPIEVQRAQPRIVRADTYLAVAALEDHIASLDDALSVARARSRPAEVARLERTRAVMIDSYTRVRYAEMLSANF
jgi:hypothetical protein